NGTFLVVFHDCAIRHWIVRHSAAIPSWNNRNPGRSHHSPADVRRGKKYRLASDRSFDFAYVVFLRVGFSRRILWRETLRSDPVGHFGRGYWRDRRFIFRDSRFVRWTGNWRAGW